MQNETDEALQPSDGHRDRGHAGRGLQAARRSSETNLFAYRADEPIPAGEVYPLLDSPGFDTPSRGALLLFKLTLTALNNRPLELKIEGRKAPQQTGIVDLDV